MFIIVFLITLLVVMFVTSMRLLRDPDKPKGIALYATGTAAMDEPPIMIDRVTRRIVRQTYKSIGKYEPGYLGLSGVSRAIKADFGWIVSRRYRKLHAKLFEVPRIIYV